MLTVAYYRCKPITTSSFRRTVFSIPLPFYIYLCVNRHVFPILLLQIQMKFNLNWSEYKTGTNGNGTTSIGSPLLNYIFAYFAVDKYQFYTIIIILLNFTDSKNIYHPKKSFNKENRTKIRNAYTNHKYTCNCQK